MSGTRTVAQPFESCQQLLMLERHVHGYRSGRPAQRHVWRQRRKKLVVCPPGARATQGETCADCPHGIFLLKLLMTFGTPLPSSTT